MNDSEWTRKVVAVAIAAFAFGLAVAAAIFRFTR